MNFSILLVDKKNSQTLDLQNCFDIIDPLKRSFAMDNTYSYLKDNEALEEIRKHKWIESERQGSEMGFATAAVDWIKNYGPQWKQFSIGVENIASIFTERRHFRRFSYQWPLKIKTSNGTIASFTKDINFLGLSCLVPHHITEQTHVDVTLNFQLKESQTTSHLQFRTKVDRITKKSSNLCYEIFLPFTEEVKDYLKMRASLISNLAA